jgi:hypothetical protein
MERVFARLSEAGIRVLSDLDHQEGPTS